MNNKEFAIKTDIMRYKPNQLSFLFCVLAIVLNVAMFLIIYQETNCKSNYLLGIDLVINVVFMLAVFLLSEKSKAYNLKAGYVALVMGLIEIGRIFFIPLYYYNKHLEYLKTEEGIIGLSNSQFYWCVGLMIAAAVCLFAAGVDTIIKSRRLTAHLANISGKE